MTPSAPSSLSLARPGTGWQARPLDRLRLNVAAAPPGATVVVRDGGGREYFRAPAAASVEITVGGALGEHTVQTLGADGGVCDELRFAVDAQTAVDDDGGRFRELVEATRKAMYCHDKSGYNTQYWKGKAYRMYVHWILDQSHTAKGMQYFSDATADLVEVEAGTQREDGMVWSFVDSHNPGKGFFQSRDGGRNYYTRQNEEMTLVRQPVENHCEYNYVNTMYLAWKGKGDDAWMAAHLDSAIRALDYGMTDPVRWSERFGLLKRAYTIDSWDFQVEDKYTPDFPMGRAMLIDPERTKFGVFFGDNTGYAAACDELAEMLAVAGRAEDAARFRQRAADIRARLDALTWNGRFYVHRVEDDPTVQRDLGVDEASQIAMSNAYSINRGTTHEQSVAILRTYQDLLAHLPPGSPGEWYSIYPPFERGFGGHGGRWQYMNAGVHGHAAGELARGAFEHGFERYGADILDRVRDLAKRTDGMVHFAYTGAETPPPPPQKFDPVDITAQANMDLTDQGAPGVPGWMNSQAGNDMRNLPVGRQTFQDVPYLVPDPAANGRRGAVAVALKKDYPATVEIPVGGRKAGAVYLLHAANGVGASRVAGAITLRYEDGTEHETYMLQDKHLAGWWFPDLKNKDAKDPKKSGVAWVGPNLLSLAVGVSWVAMPNPNPDRPIRSVIVTAAGENKPIYAVMGLTLADRMPFQPPSLISYGGPDNWAGATCMFALMQGLAGVCDESSAFGRVRLSPRWTAAGVDTVSITARYPASQGYLAYQYRHDAANRTVEMTMTGSGETAELRVLLPEGVRVVRGATVNGQPATVGTERVEESLYATLPVGLGQPATVRVEYA